MMRLVHTVIASRATLHSIHNKITMLVHKGLFDKNDQESLNYFIDERLLQVRSPKLTVGVSHSSLHTNRYRVIGSWPWATPAPRSTPTSTIWLADSLSAGMVRRAPIPTTLSSPSTGSSGRGGPAQAWCGLRTGAVTRKPTAGRFLRHACALLCPVRVLHHYRAIKLQNAPGPAGQAYRWPASWKTIAQRLS